MKFLWLFIAILLAIVSYGYVKNNKLPRDLGVAGGKLAPLPKTPNAVSSQTGSNEKKVEPLLFKNDYPSTRKVIIKILQDYGNIEIVKEDENYIHAVSTSNFLKFKDDLEFYFDTTEGIVHFRSSSRVGYSDMGVNRARYERLKELYLNTLDDHDE